MTSKAFGLAQLGNAYADGALSNRNKIINGAMTIDQRNAGASVTANGGIFPVDRFVFNTSQDGKATAQRSTVAPSGFTNSLLYTSSSAYSVLSSDLFALEHRLEGFNTSDLAFGTASASAVTASFWVRSSLTGSFGGALTNSARNRSYPFSYTISAANTWEYKTVTIAGDTSGTWSSDNSRSLILIFSLGAGSTYSGTAGSWSGSTLTQPTGSTSVVATSGATFYLTGVQLEAGDTATPFEHRSYGQELALCQRYFQKYTNPPLRGVASTVSTSGRSAMVLPNTMRASPTVSISGTLSIFDGGGVDTTTVIGVSYARADKVELDLVTTGTLNVGNPTCVYEGGVGGSISLSAEL
jgi:hypothetical protein